MDPLVCMLRSRGDISRRPSQLARKKTTKKPKVQSSVLPRCFSLPGQAKATAPVVAETQASLSPISPSPSSPLPPLCAGGVSLSSSSHHRTDRRVGQVELARDVGGRVLLQEPTETERGVGEVGRWGRWVGGVWRGRHKRESRAAFGFFLPAPFTLNRQPQRPLGAELRLWEQLELASASFLRKCRSRRVCSARTRLRHDGVCSIDTSWWQDLIRPCLRGCVGGGFFLEREHTAVPHVGQQHV